MTEVKFRFLYTTHESYEKKWMMHLVPIMDFIGFHKDIEEYTLRNDKPILDVCKMMCEQNELTYDKFRFRYANNQLVEETHTPMHMKISTNEIIFVEEIKNISQCRNDSETVRLRRKQLHEEEQLWYRMNRQALYFADGPGQVWLEGPGRLEIGKIEKNREKLRQFKEEKKQSQNLDKKEIDRDEEQHFHDNFKGKDERDNHD